MAAGKYRERVTIYTPALTIETAFGRKPTGPEASLETWAAVQQLQAKTFFEDGKLYFKQPYRITLRYVNAPDLQFANRVEWDGKRISVASITTDAKKTVTTIYGYGE
jgi:head-tail adaptor